MVVGDANATGVELCCCQSSGRSPTQKFPQDLPKLDGLDFPNFRNLSLLPCPILLIFALLIGNIASPEFQITTFQLLVEYSVCIMWLLCLSTGPSGYSIVGRLRS